MDLKKLLAAGILTATLPGGSLLAEAGSFNVQPLQQLVPTIQGHS